MKKLAFLVLFAGAIGLVHADDYSQWGYYKPLTINTSAAAGVDNQINFPLLVRLTSADADVFSMAGGTGSDIRFAKTDGTHLSYQIESWNSAAKSAAIWVKIDTIFGSQNSQAIRMYWGKPGSADSSNGKAVFDTANGFAGVWHLNDANCADASFNARNGVASGTEDTLGAVGPGRKFNPVNSDNIKISGLMGNPAQFTVSAWINFNNYDGSSQGCDAVSIGNYVMVRAMPSAAPQGIYAYGSASWRTTNAGGSSIQGAGWTHVVYTCNPAGANNQRQYMYINGTASGTAGNNTNAVTYSGQGSDTYIGHHGNGESNWQFGGVLDEVRIEKVVRSAPWVALCYQNQMPGSSLITEGSTTQQGSGALPAVPQLSSPANGATGNFLAVTLAWGSSTGSTTYSVQVSTSASFATTVTRVAGLSGTTAALSGLSANATYYWEVCGNNTTGAGNWSGVWSFSIFPPAAPVLSSPTNGYAAPTTSVMTLAWGSVAGGGTYGVQVSTVNNFASTILNASGLAQTSTTVNVGVNTTYYWRANATNVIGAGNWSGAWSFSVLPPAPSSAPVLASPSNGASVKGNQYLTLSWNSVAMASTYLVQVSTSSNMAASIFYQSTGLTTAGLTVAASQYFWRVAAQGVGGSGPWSAVWSFSAVVPVLNESVEKAVTAVSVANGVLHYTLGRPGIVDVRLYNMLGKQVVFKTERQNAGTYKLSFTKAGLPDGRYVLAFKSGMVDRRIGLVVAR